MHVFKTAGMKRFFSSYNDLSYKGMA